MEKNNLKYFAVLIFAVLILFFVFYETKVLEKNYFPAELKVSESSGFNVDAESLNFGSLVPGATAARKIKIENGYDFPIVLEVDFEGNVSNFLFCENKLVFESNETGFLEIQAAVPADEDYGIYSGEVIVKIRKYLK